MIKSGQYYRNIKTNRYYQIAMVAIDVTNQDESDMVVYSRIDNSELYLIMELNQFLKKFKLTE